ncbi:hypothetical protein ACFOW4_16305 [Micromonospora sp. GCM10011542]|uniref:hypothetical protein n=1 Tax=Micromonospora sp. GCM10011542 TaxID=3317337 RepID=UPI00361776C4
MFFAVQGMLSPTLVPTAQHVSIQRALERGRVVLDAAVPDEVAREHGRLRPVPPIPPGLSPAEQRRFVLEHLLGQVAAATGYISMPADDLPPFVWELFAAARPVVFTWSDPTTGEPVARVVVAVWRGVPGPRQP